MKKLLFVLLASASAAQAFELGLPVKCEIGRECFVQNYVDREPGPGYRDYTCGHLSYPAHKGTDIRVATVREMEKGVEVVAAAEGIVKAMRDGEEDRLLSEKGSQAVENRECGNAVVLTHPEGWETIYCHLRKGSVVVKKGDAVKQGQMLGLIGLSGSAEFPHVHLQVVQGGTVRDPFTGDAMETACGDITEKTLWSPEAKRQLAYPAGGFLAGGFTSATPNLSGIVKGQFQETTIAPNAPAIIFWAESFGLRMGDIIAMKLTGPDDEVIAEQDTVQAKDQAVSFQLIGKKNRATLAPGTYRGEYTVTRPGREDPVAKYEASVEVK